MYSKQSNLKQIQIHVFGGKKELYEKIFPEEYKDIDTKNGKVIIRERTEETKEIKWISYKYPELQDSNYKDIFFKLIILLTHLKKKKLL